MAKKMYVIQAEDGMFFCGMRYWDKQIRKAKIYHSLTYAKDVVDAYEESNCKIVEVSLAIVPEAKTNADRIRAMSDEELADFFFESPEIEFTVCEYCQYFGGHTSDTPCRHDMGRCFVSAKNEAFKKWLKQPAE